MSKSHKMQKKIIDNQSKKGKYYDKLSLAPEFQINANHKTIAFIKSTRSTTILSLAMQFGPSVKHDIQTLY